MPVGPENHNQRLMQIDKREDGNVVKRRLMSVVFVPLTNKNKQWPASRYN